MDWSKLENIIFVSAIGVLTLFLAVSAIVVIVKGKRRCGGFDVFLRIMSSLVLALSVVLFAAFVFTQLDGSYRIDVSGEPTLVFGTASIVLPLPDLFVALSTTVGSNLVTVALIISLATLICDCLSANVKKDKLETKSDDGTEISNADNGERLESAAVDETTDKAHDASTESAPAGVADGDEASDETDDETPAVCDEADEASDRPWYNEDGKFDMDEPVRDESQNLVGDENADVEESFDAVSADDESAERDGAADEETEAEATEDNDEQSDGEVEVEQDDESDADMPFDESAAARGSEEYTDETIVEAFEDNYEADNACQTEVADEADETDGETDNEADDTPWYAQTGETESEESGENTVEEREQTQERAASADTVEPDRDIYIPEIRTVERTESAPRTAGAKRESRENTRRPARTQRRSVPPRQSKQVEPTMAERAASAAIRNGAKRSSSKLPVNRRYVILDRRSAVNIFSDYLKERDKTDKDKLESSINTIIIK